MNTRADFWWRWLVVVTVAVLVLGAALVLFPSAMQQAFNLLFFGSPGGRPEYLPAEGYLRFAFVVLGAVMFAWAACMLVLLWGPFRHRSRDAWLAITVSLVAWFVPDTAYSLLSGFWQNAVLNGVLAILFAVPLAMTRRACSASSIGKERHPWPQMRRTSR
jgi:uncharacterized membrane protein YhaH (DUF805 family)